MIALVVAALAAALPCWAANASLRISTDPEGAELLVDGYVVGAAPVTLSVPEGMHSIVARKTGFREMKLDVEARVGAVAELTIPLTSKDAPVAEAAAAPARTDGSGRLALLHPPGATFQVDGAPVVDERKVPVSIPATLPGVPAGPRRILILVEGAPPVELSVIVPADGEVRVDSSNFDSLRSQAPVAPGAPHPQVAPPPPPPFASGPPPSAPPGSDAASREIPLAPANLTVSPVDGSGRVRMDWIEARGAAAYNVYRSDSAGGPFTKANDQPFTGRTLVLGGLRQDTRYYFRVSSVSPTGAESEASPPVSTP